MNDHDDDELLQRLRGLPGERLPPARVWASIAEGIAAQPRRPSAPAPVRQRSRRWPLLAGLATAASLLLVLVARPPSLPPEAMMQASLLQQADAMAGEYRQALAALPAGQMPAELVPALGELDRSAGAIHAAIGQSPEAGFLLRQLQRTYALRLELTRQGLLQAAGLQS